MELTDDLKTIFTEAANDLKEYARRVFMARVVNALGKGSQRQAEAELNWCRDTIRKGQQELEGGFCHIDRFADRGRKRAKEHLPNSVDPNFRPRRSRKVTLAAKLLRLRPFLPAKALSRDPRGLVVVTFWIY